MAVRWRVVLASPSLLFFATAAHADDPDARAYFRPHDPVAFVALSAGFGGFGAGSTTTGPDNHTVGTIGAGMLAARLDLEALAPLWVSVTGRAFGGHPAQGLLDASLGYELRWYINERASSGYADYSRIQLRPFVGVRELRFAGDPYAPTTERVTAARAGADFALVSSVGLRGWDLARARLQVLWDAVGRGPGIEFEDVIGITTKSQTFSGGFVGLTLGGMPSTGFLFQIELGAQWEVGR